MPTVTIEVRHSYSTEQELAIIDAVHQAMMIGIKTPDWDKNIRFISHLPHRFTSPPDKSERYTLISFDMFAGRSIEAKRRLYKELVNRLTPLGIPANDILIVLREHPRENWGIQGGQCAADIHIPFTIEV